MDALLDGAEPTRESLLELWSIADAFQKMPNQGSVYKPPSEPVDFRVAIREAVEGVGVLTEEIADLKRKDPPRYGEPGFVSVLTEFEE